MGFNSFYAEHLIKVEKIDIYHLPIDQIVSDLIQRIL